MSTTQDALAGPESRELFLFATTLRQMADSPCDFPALQKLACDGDRSAKHALVLCLNGLVWHSIGEFRMSREDAQDVYASSFCRFFEHLPRIRDPERIPGWIVTTTRNEAKTLLRARGREVVTDDVDGGFDAEPLADDRLLDNELYAAIRAGFRMLPRPCQRLLRYLVAEPPLPYDTVGEIMNMPHGSIGPTRRRCLDRLRGTPPLRPFTDGG